VAVVSRHFGSEKADWLPGRRSDDPGRAAALGYRSASSVSHAIRRIEGDKSQRRILDKIESELT
jgi:hypothetical protein